MKDMKKFLQSKIDGLQARQKELLQRARKSKHGFTLIELIIVIAIIGVLVAMIMPNFAKNTEDAQIARAKSDIRLISSAIQLYAAQTGKGSDMEGDILDLCDTLMSVDESTGYGPWLVSCPKSPWSDESEYIYRAKNIVKADNNLMVIYIKIPSGKYLVSTDLSKLWEAEPSESNI